MLFLIGISVECLINLRSRCEICTVSFACEESSVRLIILDDWSLAWLYIIVMSIVKRIVFCLYLLCVEVILRTHLLLSINFLYCCFKIR